MTDISTQIQFEQAGAKGRYFIVMPNGEDSLLTYIRSAADHWIADHTFVPPPYRGDGVAEAMVARLIDDARAAGAKITPACWFVADEFERHPEWTDLLKR